MPAATASLTADDELHWLALRMAAGLFVAVAQSIASGCAFEEAVEQPQKAASLP